MTTGCIEYWFMLHRRYYTPSLQTTAEKEKVISDLKLEEPLYKKGNREITAKIAKDYPIAVKYAKKTLARLLDEGMPCLEDTDIRNQWLLRPFPMFLKPLNFWKIRKTEGMVLVTYSQISKVCLAKKEFLKCIVFPLHYTFFIYRPFSFT